MRLGSAMLEAPNDANDLQLTVRQRESRNHRYCSLATMLQLI
jgi:hypothetical protein